MLLLTARRVGDRASVYFGSWYFLSQKEGFKKNMNNFNNKNVQDLDILEVLAFYIQLKNIEWDQNQNQYIHSVVQNIDKQIAKLHQENDIIMKQNEQILMKLERIKL